MSFPDPLTFFKGFGIMVTFLLLGAGLFYWVGILFKKYRYTIKYKILRRKYNEATVSFLLDDIKMGVDPKEIFKALYLSGKTSKAEIREIRYIYDNLKAKMKGGNKKNE